MPQTILSFLFKHNLLRTRVTIIVALLIGFAGLAEWRSKAGPRLFPTTPGVFIAAPPGVWTNGGPYGGRVRTLAINPTTPATLYTGTYGGGVFKSTDSGGTWAAASTGLTELRVYALAINPTTPATLYAGTYFGGVFKSSDSGGTWAAASTGLTNPFIAVLAINTTNPATLYAGTYGGGVFKSTDSGGTWAAANTGLADLTVKVLVINPATPATLYAGTSDGVFKSTDSGGTWSAANTGLANLNVNVLAINPSTPATLYAGTYFGGVFKSSDSGGTWAPANTGLTDLRVYALAINPTLPSTLYAGTGDDFGSQAGGVFKSTDSGATWTAVNTGLANLIVRVLAINPTTPATLYTGTNGGVFMSTDSGDTWAAANTKLTSLNVPTMAINPTTPSTLYAGTGDDLGGFGVLKSTDSGATWAASNTGLTELRVYALAINPTTPATLYAGSLGGGVFRSTDSGGTWAAANTGLTNLQVVVLAINPTTPATLYAGTLGGGVFKSIDSGGTWAASNTGLANLNVAVLRINPATPVTLYAATRGGVFKSTDSGGTWAATNTGLTNPDVTDLAINSTTPTTLYAGTYGSGVFKSTDSGGTWSASNTGLTYRYIFALAINPTTPATLDAGTWSGFGSQAGGVFKSTDSGGTWVAVNSGLPNLPVVALARDPAGATTLYAGLLYGSVWRLTADAIPTPTPTLSINDVSVVEGNAGTATATFTVSLSASSGQTVSVNYATANGTATAGSDYVAASGSLNFTPGQTSQPISVTINGDLSSESNETFFVDLSTAVNATISDNQGMGTINDDDSQPTLSINDVAVTEGDAGTLNATFTVTLSTVSGLTVTVQYATADGTAIAPSDYTAIGATTLTFNPGDTIKHISVSVNGDTLVEPDEGFFVNLSNPANATLSDNQGVGTIYNDDVLASVQFSAANYNVGEGDTSVIVTVNRSGDTSGVSTVDFASSNGTASQLRDYEVANGTLTFAGGQTSRTFRVLIVDDVYAEAGETINLTLSNPNGAVLTAPSAATVTIVDNDSGGFSSPVARQFVSNLTGADEVPATPNTVKGNGGIVQLSNDELSAKVSLLFSGLTGSETGAHVHAGAPGVNGPIIFPLPLGNPINNFVISPTGQQVIDLRAGQQYMNVHSTGFLNGEIRGQLQWNPAEEADFFVRQAYFDFLSRVPDPSGFTFWTNEITQCQSDVECLRRKRVDVSNAFFYELEFQQTAAYVLRLYRGAYGNNQPFPNPNPNANFPNEEKKLPSYAVFVADRARVIGGANLAQKQLDLANLFVSRPEFLTKYPASLATADQFVDAVLATLQTDMGVNLSGQRANLINLYNTQGGRGVVMYRLADDNAANPIANQPFIDEEYNRTFVLGQYFGYLRRNPDIPGFIFWLGQVSGAPLRDVPRQHAMVCSFITSGEFQFRFGPVASRTNNECPQ